MDVDSNPAAASKPAQIGIEDPTDAKGKGKAGAVEEDEGKGKNEELAASIGSLSIGPGRTIFKKKPVIIIVIGMDGTGKTTFMHRLVCHTQASNMRGYVLNLDPAVMTLPFGANIDIRDTVRYKEVMKEYGLGPNGAILSPHLTQPVLHQVR